MLLHRVHIDLRCREARRDLADPYQLHATLCRAFAPPEVRCPPGAVLWRLEPETDSAGNPRIVVQSQGPAVWSRVGVRGWLASVDPAMDTAARLQLSSLQPNRVFRFRLRANPCVSRNGKRLGLMQLEEQEQWLVRKGAMHGFVPRAGDAHAAHARSGIRVSQERMLVGRQRGGNGIHIYSVLYDGFLTVTEPGAFVSGLRSGIGHGKALGLGLLSVAPAD
jgi:CRISPR system Cascade subunit CasE